MYLYVLNDKGKQRLLHRTALWCKCIAVLRQANLAGKPIFNTLFGLYWSPRGKDHTNISCHSLQKMRITERTHVLLPKSKLSHRPACLYLLWFVRYENLCEKLWMTPKLYSNSLSYRVFNLKMQKLALKALISDCWWYSSLLYMVLARSDPTSAHEVVSRSATRGCGAWL